MATGQYDDAWETPGWTAQNFAYPAETPTGYALPVDIEFVTLTGKFLDGEGAPMTGWVYVTSDVTLEHGPTKTKIGKVFRKVEIVHGLLRVEGLPATDSANVTPSTPDWKYHVRVVLNGRTFLVTDLALPAAVPVVDLFDLT